jgi:hypothetical protein
VGGVKLGNWKGMEAKVSIVTELLSEEEGDSKETLRRRF